jgi:hypothetical protein
VRAVVGRGVPLPLSESTTTTCGGRSYDNLDRNIEADPRARIKIGRRWRTGTADLIPDDDPNARQRAMPAANASVVRTMAPICLPCG